MYDNARQYMPRMQMGAQPFMGTPQPQGQMSTPVQGPQANYSAIAQQMAPQGPRMDYGVRGPRQGLA
jgi:hypothetical protein